MFNAPTLNRLFDFATKVKEDEWSHLRNIIQLYPCADGSSGYHEGIVFDTFTETAMCMNPDEIRYNADQNNWVPLDIVLRAWLRRFERGYFYFDGQLKQRYYVRADLEEDVRAWEEYLEVLEGKVRERSDMATDLEQVDVTGGSLALVHPNLVRLAHSELDPVSAALLSRLRRPKYNIKRIGPGLACYDNDLFSKIFGVTQDATVSAQESGKTISISSNEMSPFVDSEWRPETISTLVFPAVGPNSGPVATGFGPNIRSRRPGMYMSATNMAPYVEILDHQGKTDVFLRRSPAVPWGTMYWGNPLSYMLKAFKTMLLNGHWTVDEEGVTGNFTWFAENRNIQWRVNRILGYIDDADGDELEISNEWIDDFLPDAELMEEDT